MLILINLLITTAAIASCAASVSIEDRGASESLDPEANQIAMHHTDGCDPGDGEVTLAESPR